MVASIHQGRNGPNRTVVAPAIIIPVTNAIEALNAKLRRAVRTRGHVPTDEGAMKLLDLVLNPACRDWKMPSRERGIARTQLAILFGDRFTLA